MLRVHCIQEAPDKTQEWIDANARGCPVCGVAIQKNGGCDHMNCANCGAKFGWNNRWHGRVAAPRPKAGGGAAGSSSLQVRPASRGGGGQAASSSVSAEDLVRAQDRDSLQALLATALRRRENFERQLQEIHYTTSTGRYTLYNANRQRARPGGGAIRQEEQSVFVGIVLIGLCLAGTVRTNGARHNSSSEWFVPLPKS